eukprot:2504934-Pleurochrysis_carterae.AAC.1
MAAIVVSGCSTMASAARRAAADASDFTALSFATEPGGRSRSVLGAAGVCGGPGRVASPRAAGTSLARPPAPPPSAVPPPPTSCVGVRPRAAAPPRAPAPLARASRLLPPAAPASSPRPATA